MGLRGGWSVSRSAWAAGITSQTAYKWKVASQNTADPETGVLRDDFADRWKVAYNDGVDLLEDEMMRRAVQGVERPVYQGGVLVGTVQEYSDTLLSYALRGKKPETYNTERHEHTGKDGAPISHNMKIEFVDPPSEKGKRK